MRPGAGQAGVLKGVRVKSSPWASDRVGCTSACVSFLKLDGDFLKFLDPNHPRQGTESYETRLRGCHFGCDVIGVARRM